jgi:hypothetical protein
MYLVTFFASVAVNTANNNYWIGVAVNNSVQSVGQVELFTSLTATNLFPLLCGCLVGLNAGDYVDIQVRNTAAAGKTMNFYGATLCIR